MSDTARLFIAFEIPENIKRIIEKRQKLLQSSLGQSSVSVKWVSKELFHLTVLFLGDVKKEKIDFIKNIVYETSARLTPFELSLAGTGFFSGRRKVSVIYEKLAGDFETPLFAVNFLSGNLRENVRKFVPHITIGRVKRNRNLYLDDIRNFDLNEKQPVFGINSLVLFESKLYPSGPVYTPLFKADITD